jgi:hypothetical protein
MLQASFMIVTYDCQNMFIKQATDRLLMSSVKKIICQKVYRLVIKVQAEDNFINI